MKLHNLKKKKKLVNEDNLIQPIAKKIIFLTLNEKISIKLIVPFQRDFYEGFEKTTTEPGMPSTSLLI